MAAPDDAEVAGTDSSLNGSATLVVGVGVSCVVDSPMTGAGDSKPVEDSGDGAGLDGIPSVKRCDMEKR